MRTRSLAVAVGLPVALALTACGGGVEGDGVASAGGGGAKRASASPSQSLSPEDAQLKFAQCMRQNGVDVPDPSSDGKTRVRITGRAIDKGKAQAAMKKCQSYLQAGGKMPDMKDPKVRDQYVKFAQCMREHGVDMPDPGADGGLVVNAKPGSRDNIEKAREACRSLVPGGGRR